MLNPIPQQPTASLNFSGLTWALEEGLLSVDGPVIFQGVEHSVSEVLDLASQEPGPLMLHEGGVVSFSLEGALVHLGIWDGTDFAFIDHRQD